MTFPHTILYSHDSSERLDKILTEYFAESPDLESLSRSQIKKIIVSGLVQVNGNAPSKAGMLIEGGDEIVIEEIRTSSDPLAAYSFELDIVFEDDVLLVVNKPAGLTVHPGAGNIDKTLVNALVARYERFQSAFEGSFRPGIVHRLDRDTTGLLVVAKNATAHHALASQFAARTVKRSYLALVYSTPRGRREIDTQDSGVIQAPLSRDPHNKLRMGVVEGGKAAETHWRVVSRMNHAVLLHVELKTGRTHQIRVHMNSIGSPLIGDPLYGDTSNLPFALREQEARFGRQALHAGSIGFVHPITGEEKYFEQDPPNDFQDLLSAFKAES